MEDGSIGSRRNVTNQSNHEPFMCVDCHMGVYKSILSGCMYNTHEMISTIHKERQSTGLEVMIAYVIYNMSSRMLHKLHISSIVHLTAFLLSSHLQLTRFFA